MFFVWWISAAGLWLLVRGVWYVSAVAVFVVWFMVAVFVVWFMVSGQWSVVFDQWSVVSGLGSLASRFRSLFKFHVLETRSFSLFHVFGMCIKPSFVGA